MSRDDELYGPLWDTGLIEEAALDRIDLWEDAHLAAKERADGLTPRSLGRALTKTAGGAFGWEPAQKLPMLLIFIRDTKEIDRQAGSHSGDLELDVTVVVEARDTRSARRKARRLAAAYASILLAHPGFHPSVAEVTWERDDSDLIPEPDGERRVAAAARVLNISFNAGPAGRGAATPPAEPYDPPAVGPSATSVNLTVTPEHEDH